MLGRRQHEVGSLASLGESNTPQLARIGARPFARAT